MPSNSSSGWGARRPPGADDFTQIRGINPKIATRLYEVGILTFAKLAMMSPDDIAARIGLLSGVSPESIAKKDWVGQAQDFASKAQLVAETSAGADNQQRADFAVKLQFNADNTVSQTHVMHMQSGLEEIWDGWIDERLINFFVQRANLILAAPEAKTEAVVEAAPPLQPTTEAVVEAAPTLPPTAETVAEAEPPLQPKVEAVVEPAPPLPPKEVTTEVTRKAMTKGATKDPAPTSAADLKGEARLQDLVTAPARGSQPSRTLSAGKPFDMRLLLDLSEIKSPQDTPLNYTLTVYAKGLDAQRFWTLTEMHGKAKPTEKVALRFGAAGLPQGVYRLQATVRIMPPAKANQSEASINYLDGGLLRVR